MPDSIINKRGQTTVPKAIREALGVGPGDKIRYILMSKRVRILPVSPTSSVKGVLAEDGPPVSQEEMDNAIAEGPVR